MRTRKERQTAQQREALLESTHPGRLELPTPRLEGGCSIRLSYGCKIMWEGVFAIIPGVYNTSSYLKKQMNSIISMSYNMVVILMKQSA